ncbi:MAG: FxLYD domain-containing protein [Chloroflexota bacterium]|nr:FxLYD domain-containing protein [Chloroflexota bacterium]
MTRQKRVFRAIALSSAILVAVLTLACSCQLGNLINRATEVPPTVTPIVPTATLEPTQTPLPKPTETPTPVLITREMLLHTNEEAGIHIQYPAGWFVESEADVSYFGETEDADPVEGAVFAIFAGPLEDIEADIGPVESLEQIMTALVGEGFIPEGGEVGEYENLRPDVMVVSASWVDDFTEQPTNALLGVTLSGDWAGVMVGMTVAEEWEPHLAIFRAMAESVELFEPVVIEAVVRDVPGTVIDLEGELEFGSYRGWVDGEGDFQVVAEVTNIGNQTYDTYVDVYWRLLDANDDVLLEDSSYLDRPVLSSGETSSFWSFSWGSDLEGGTINDIVSFEMWLEVSEIERSEVMIQVVEHSGGLMVDEFIVEGTVSNNLDASVYDIYVYATLYDLSGNVVNVIYGWPDSDELAPGQQSSYTLSAWSDWEEAVDYGNVFATGSLIE